MYSRMCHNHTSLLTVSKSKSIVHIMSPLCCILIKYCPVATEPIVFPQNFTTSRNSNGLSFRLSNLYKANQRKVLWYIYKWNITPLPLRISTKAPYFQCTSFYFCPHFSWPSFMMSMQVYSQTKMLTFFKRTVYAFLWEKFRTLSQCNLF